MWGLRSLLVLLVISLAGCSDKAETEKPGSHLAVEEVADGIYVHRGKHVPFDSAESDDIANIGFIVGDDCVAVIDTGGSVAMGNALRKTIRSMTNTPICYIINSHVHYDHVLGNLPFKQQDVRFIGHHELADAMAGSRSFFAEEFPQYLGTAGKQAVVGPDDLVTDTMVIDLGNRPLELRAWRSAHTNNDLTIYDRKTRTLWAADLLFMERMPALDASLKGWLAVMDELETIPADRVVPGHGPASAAWPDALAAQQRYLTTLLEQTRHAIQSGQFLDEALESVAADEAGQWVLSDQHHGRNVSRAYTQLEWE